MKTIELKEHGIDYYDFPDWFLETNPVIIFNGNCQRIDGVEVGEKIILKMVDKNEEFIVFIVSIHANYFAYNLDDVTLVSL